MDDRDPSESNCDVGSISFCMVTDGRSVDKCRMAIDSIDRTMKNFSGSHEIIIAGVTEGLRDATRSRVCFDAPALAEGGYLGRLRNAAAARSDYDVLVFVDDDILFPHFWMSRLLEYSALNRWQILGNRILLPDGGRYWDRAITKPHRMVDYDHPISDPRLYQCGCFWVMKREVFKVEQWDETIPFYHEKSGGINEDIEFSRRLIDQGYRLSFDKANTVWHWNDQYMEFETGAHGKRCILKSDLAADYRVQRFPGHCDDFEQLLRSLEFNP